MARHARNIGSPRFTVVSLVIKECRCCGRRLTSADWEGLQKLRPQRFGTWALGMYYPDPENPDLEMRNCSCGSTLSIPLRPE
jgi:hypothetical protein